MSSWKFEAIGTVWTISSRQKISRSVMQNVTDRIEIFDQFYSRFRSDSLVTKMFQATGEYILPANAQPMLDFYKQLYQITDGLVTPLIGRTIEQTGYDANYSFKSSKLTSPPSWDGALDYDFPKLTIKKPVLLDFGAAGKGYLVDIIGDILLMSGVKDFYINAGGDILVHGQPQTILLEDPGDKTVAIGQVEIKNSAICGSGIGRRNWGKYHHIVDPKKLVSPTHVKSVWVRAKSTMLADGLATALYFVEPGKLREHFQFEYAMIVKGGIQLSQNFRAEFFRK